MKSGLAARAAASSAAGDVQAIDLALERAVPRRDEVRPGPAGSTWTGRPGVRSSDRGVDHPVALGELPDQRPILFVKVEVHESVALGEPEEWEPSPEEDRRRVAVLVDPVGYRLLDQGHGLAALRRPAVSTSSVWSRFTVMKSASIEVRRPVKNGSTYSAPAGSGTSAAARARPGQRMEQGGRVSRTDRWIAGVADGRWHGSIVGDRIVLHGGIVQAQVDHPDAIGRPGVGRLGCAGSQLLVVHPVQATLEDGLGPVRRQARDLAVDKGQDVKVVVLHVGDHCAVGRERLPGHGATFLTTDLSRPSWRRAARATRRPPAAGCLRSVTTAPRSRRCCRAFGRIERVSCPLLPHRTARAHPRHPARPRRPLGANQAPVEARRAGADQAFGAISVPGMIALVPSAPRTRSWTSGQDCQRRGHRWFGSTLLVQACSTGGASSPPSSCLSRFPDLQFHQHFFAVPARRAAASPSATMTIVYPFRAARQRTRRPAVQIRPPLSAPCKVTAPSESFRRLLQEILLAPCRPGSAILKTTAG